MRNVIVQQSLKAAKAEAESLKVGQYGGMSGGKSGQGFRGMHVPCQWSLGVSLALCCGNSAQVAGLELSSSM